MTFSWTNLILFLNPRIQANKTNLLHCMKQNKEQGTKSEGPSSQTFPCPGLRYRIYLDLDFLVCTTGWEGKTEDGSSTYVPQSTGILGRYFRSLQGGKEKLSGQLPIYHCTLLTEKLYCPAHQISLSLWYDPLILPTIQGKLPV